MDLEEKELENELEENEEESKQTEAMLESVRQMSDFSWLVHIQLAIERLRIATQVRLTHLAKQNKADAPSEEAFGRLKELESWIDIRVAEKLAYHPAYHWFSTIKGIGSENIGKVLRYLDINKASYISSFWKYAGYSVEDGKSPRAKKGEKTTYNYRLRTFCWRLGVALRKARGAYYDYYVERKAIEKEKFIKLGFQVVTAEEFKKLKKEAKETTVSEVWVNNRALRKMIKLFLSHLFVVWREAEGLPVSPPYAIERLGHKHYYDPWTFIDKAKEKKLEKKRNNIPEKVKKVKASSNGRKKRAVAIK